MGGAEKLEDDLKQVNADIYISANEHGAKLMKCDYIFAMDETHGNGQPMGKYLRQFSDAPIISPCDYGDIKPHSWPRAPRRIYSGLNAAWMAWVMGAKVVILAGFDAYNQNAGALRKAQLFVDEIKCPVRVVGGTMGNLWPAYKKGERFKFEKHPAIDTLLGTGGIVTVIVKKPTQICGVDVVKGQKWVGRRYDIRSLLKHKMVEEVPCQ